MKLKDDVGVGALEALIRDAHEWVDYVPNTKADSTRRLSPVAVSGSLKVGVGRLRRLSVGDGMYSLLTTGDHGAAAPGGLSALTALVDVLLATPS